MTNIPNAGAKQRLIKPPSLLACISCRKSHVKCTGVKPVCVRCTQRGIECIWTESRRGYRDNRRPPDTQQAIIPGTSRDGEPPEWLGEDLDQGFDGTVRRASSNDTSPASASDSTTSIVRQEPASSTTANDDLIDIFYKHIFPSQPFLIPRQLYRKSPTFLPDYLKAVIRFAASHYRPVPKQAALFTAAKDIFSESVPDNAFKVQGLALFAFTSFCRYDHEHGAKAHSMSINLALRLGMNHASFAVEHGQGDPILEESWRRTWWYTFISDGLAKAVLGPEHSSRLQAIQTDVPLPCSEEDYNALIPPRTFRTLDDMAQRTILEDPFEYSSFAYMIEAIRVLLTIFHLSTDTFSVSPASVSAVDSSISTFLLSLPSSKREPTVNPATSTVDELLVRAHTFIHWSSILLHRPRSTLTFIKNHYHTVCTQLQPLGFPTLSYSSHTSKTLHAANQIVNLVSLSRPINQCSPDMICALAMSATVHLPAYAVADNPADAKAIEERLKLTISALGRFAETWQRGAVIKSQVAAFAREVLMVPKAGLNVNKDLIIPSADPSLRNGHIEVDTDQAYVMETNMQDNRMLDQPPPQAAQFSDMLGDSWMHNFMQIEMDPSWSHLDKGIFDTFNWQAPLDDTTDMQEALAEDLG